jgi:TonB family protein
MTSFSKCRLVLALMGFAAAAPCLAQDAAHPDTARMVKEAVEAYYETKPNLRPTPAWLASAPPPTCSKPRYPRAGLREELEGTTVLRFDLTAEGKATNARIARSSGWAVLDEAALESISLCAFQAQTPSTDLSVSYRFYLE